MWEKSKPVRLYPEEQQLIALYRKNKEQLLSELNEVDSFLPPSVYTYIYLRQLKAILTPNNQTGFTLERLEQVQMLTPKQLVELQEAVTINKNIIITGSSATGKTTLLQALLEFKTRIPNFGRLLITERMGELKGFSGEKPEIKYKKLEDLSIFDYNFLQEQKGTSLLCIGTFHGKEESLAMTTALSIGSSVITTMQERDWKSQLTDISREYFTNQSFTIVHINRDQTISSIEEENLI